MTRFLFECGFHLSREKTCCETPISSRTDDHALNTARECSNIPRTDALERKTEDLVRGISAEMEEMVEGVKVFWIETILAKRGHLEADHHNRKYGAETHAWKLAVVEEAIDC